MFQLPVLPSAVRFTLFVGVVGLTAPFSFSQDVNSIARLDTRIVKLWPSEVPSWKAPQEAERDTTKTDGATIGGQRVMRLTNVSSPELHVYPAGGDHPSETAIIVCPGGGYQILAWDLEGTEIATWLQSLGVTAVVCKYRVPSPKTSEDHWMPAVQDIQRSIGLLRSGAIGVAPKRIGTIGFSAGGNASARAALATKRYYDRIDASDDENLNSDFAALIYPAWLTAEDDLLKLSPDFVVTENSPPMFFAHAADDRISCMNSVTMFTALQQVKVPAALNIFASGGHGFGSRRSDTADDHWPALLEAWMADQGWIRR